MCIHIFTTIFCKSIKVIGVWRTQIFGFHVCIVSLDLMNRKKLYCILVFLRIFGSGMSHHAVTNIFHYWIKVVGVWRVLVFLVKTGCNKICQSCHYDFSEKVNLREHTEPIHIEKRLNKISICDYAYSQKSETWHIMSF